MKEKCSEERGRQLRQEAQALDNQIADAQTRNDEKATAKLLKDRAKYKCAACGQDFKPNEDIYLDTHIVDRRDENGNLVRDTSNIAGYRSVGNEPPILTAQLTFFYHNAEGTQ